MKLLFKIEDQVHFFQAVGEIALQDLVVLKKSLFHFFESNPTYTVLDFSSSHLSAPKEKFKKLLIEIKSLSESKNLYLIVAEDLPQSRNAKNTVLGLAINHKIEALQAKLELREKIKADAEKLLNENLSLKKALQDQNEKLKEVKIQSRELLSPLFEKLWSEK
jgi:hypothetical protein